MESGEVIKDLPKSAKQIGEDTRLFTDEEFVYTRYWKKASPMGAFEFRKFQNLTEATEYLTAKCPTIAERDKATLVETNKKNVKLFKHIRSLVPTPKEVKASKE